MTSLPTLASKQTFQDNHPKMATKPDQKQGQQQSTFLRKVNIFIGRTSRKEVLTFLLFVLVSGFFWIVQTSREETASEFMVELIIEDQPQGMVFTTRIPPSLKVTITDTNARLLNYSVNDRLKSLSVNFERYADAIGNFRISAAELQSLLRERLFSSTQITAVSPSLIDARFALTEGRKFPVVVSGVYVPADNYRLRPMIIEPDSVIINAPNMVLDTLNFVYTVAASHYDLRDTLTETLPLELPIGVKATPASVKVTAPVAQYVEKVFDNLVVNTTNLPNGKRLLIFPYSVRLSCFVDFHHYRQLTEEDFDISVSYDSIATSDGRHLPILIKYKDDPTLVTNIQIYPQKVEYILE